MRCNQPCVFNRAHRKDFIDKEEEARKSPNRNLYFRRAADYDRLIEVCSRKLSENPRHIRALLIRASSYLKKGTCRVVVSPPLLNQQNPKNGRGAASMFLQAESRPLSTLQWWLMPAGALPECLADYNVVLSVEPKNIDALYHRGCVYEKLSRLDDAIADFTSVLQLDPNHIKASYSRGACRNLKGEFSQAIGAHRCCCACRLYLSCILLDVTSWL